MKFQECSGPNRKVSRSVVSKFTLVCIRVCFHRLIVTLKSFILVSPLLRREFWRCILYCISPIYENDVQLTRGRIQTQLMPCRTAIRNTIPRSSLQQRKPIQKGIKDVGMCLRCFKLCSHAIFGILRNLVLYVCGYGISKG